MTSKQKRQYGYGQIWDAYVNERFPKIKASTPYSKTELAPWRVLNTKDDEYDWPGDEWGDQETAEQILSETLINELGAKASHLCEIGAGAGRYTTLALERYPQASFLSFDVSAAFEKALKQRCSQFVASGRLRSFLLNGDPLFFFNTLKQEGLIGKIDAVYSFDAMVHVDLHTLLLYWVSAARALRPGGVLAMNLADACSEKGFMKLLFAAPTVFGHQGNIGSQFMWVSREIVDRTLTRIGFKVSYSRGNGRDLFVTAKLVDRDRSIGWFEKAGATWLPT